MVLVGGMQAHRELKEAHGFDVGEVNVTIPDKSYASH